MMAGPFNMRHSQAWEVVIGLSGGFGKYSETDENMTSSIYKQTEDWVFPENGAVLQSYQ